MPGIESGRSRRRRESSSDSRRRRRDRRRRDRTRSRERSRGRSPRSRRSEASSSLPVAEPGYRSCQIPETVLHGGTGPAVAQAPLPPPPAPHVQQWPDGLHNSAEPQWRPPAHGSRSLGSHFRKPGARRLGASVVVAVPANGTRAGASRGRGRRAGTNGLRRTKAVTGPSKTPKISLRREARFRPQRQLPPRKILTKWRWPHRKRRMRLQLGRPSVRMPEPVLERCACIFAWFKQNNRPVFQVEGRAIEGSIFKVPGQMVVLFPTTIHGPSYKEPANHRNSMTISHGLPWTSALGVGQLGELAPGDFTEGEFPSYGFSGRGSCNEFIHSLLHH